MNLTTSQTQLNFKGLNKTLAKAQYKKASLKTINNLYPNSNGIVGNLPAQWIKQMPKENRREIIKTLYNELGEIFNSIPPGIPTEENEKNLTTALQKAHAISNTSKMTISYVNCGAYSNGYELYNIKDGSSLFLKKFRAETLFDNEGHGALCENNTKVLLKKQIKNKADKKFFTKFYFGDINNGYYIEEFLTNHNSLPQLPYKICNPLVKNFQNILRKLGLHHHDCSNFNYKSYKKDGEYNIVVFDLGGVKKI